MFGKPRSRLEPAGDDEWRVVMEGVDIYDPISNTITPSRADKVAAWFVDSDYDGRPARNEVMRLHRPEG